MWGPQGGFQGESCRLRVFSFVPVEPSNLGRAAEKGRWGGRELSKSVESEVSPACSGPAGYMW